MLFPSQLEAVLIHRYHSLKIGQAHSLLSPIHPVGGLRGDRGLEQCQTAGRSPLYLSSPPGGPPDSAVPSPFTPDAQSIFYFHPSISVCASISFFLSHSSFPHIFFSPPLYISHKGNSFLCHCEFSSLWIIIVVL